MPRTEACLESESSRERQSQHSFPGTSVALCIVQPQLKDQGQPRSYPELEGFFHACNVMLLLVVQLSFRGFTNGTWQTPVTINISEYSCQWAQALCCLRQLAAQCQPSTGRLCPQVLGRTQQGQSGSKPGSSRGHWCRNPPGRAEFFPRYRASLLGVPLWSKSEPWNFFHFSMHEFCHL